MPVILRFCFAFSLLLFITPVFCATGGAPDGEDPEPEKGFMGIAYSVVTDIPLVEGLPPVSGGILVSDVLDGRPAQKAGMQRMDIILSIEGFLFDGNSGDTEDVFQSVLDQCQPGDTIHLEIIRMSIDTHLTIADVEYDADAFLNAPMAYISRLPDGAGLKLSATKDWRKTDIELVLGRRTEGLLAAPPTLDQTDLKGLFDRPGWETWVDELVDQYDIHEAYEDLRERLQNLHESDDGYRLPLVSGIHRDPYLLESVATELSDLFLDATDIRDLDLSRVLLYKIGEKHNWNPPDITRLDPKTDTTGFSKWFTGHMEPLMDALMSVYDVFSEEEKAFLMEHRFDLLEAFSGHIYIDRDADTRRYARNRKTLELAGRIDLPELYKASDRILQFAIGSYEDVFAWMENNPEVRSLETPWGRIGFGTTGNDWWRDDTVQFIYDPAGDDLYSDGAGVASCFERPAAWIIDLEGDDAYQSTAPYGAQGSGIPGVGLLYDKSGNDTYIGQRLAQGTGFMGIGILFDREGNDRYYGSEFAQGAALFGFGLLFDAAGNDTYHGNKHAQGCGFTHGLGVLYDAGGNDQGFATGKYPTNYGDPGIFDAWSQGVGMGFRTIASGGIGMVVSGGGDDHWESGNFAQGGGYYYGMGIFRSGGEGDDTYIGSRYAQGFSAHQAIGAFIEDGGNDRYLTRHMASLGLAWDESVSLFIDRGGDDYYDGGSGFSIGASAHNSFAIFIDQGGRDEFHHQAGPARAGGNDYHGGHSFSLFVSQGEETNHYSSGRVQNDVELFWPDFGFFRDGKAIPKTSPREKQ